MYIIITRELKRLLKAWPALVLLSIIGGHWFLIYCYPQNKETIDKIISLALQLLGGLLILYSIDSNIGIIKNKNLFSIFINYLKEFSLSKNNQVIEAAFHINSNSFFEAKVTTTQNPQNIEKHLEYLQKQIHELKRDLDHESKDLRTKIDGQSNKLNSLINETKSDISTIESKMVEISIGGLKTQLFGVSLIFYGTILGANLA